MLHNFPDKNTNIFEILDYITSRNPQASREPKGVDRFLGALGLIGMSENLIPSKRLKPFVSGVRPQVGTGRKRIIKWIKLYR